MSGRLVRAQRARTLRRALPALIVAAFVALAAAFSLRVPPFETPDEVYHYAFARRIAQGNGLPVQAATPTGPWEHEGSQAPLYYLITGLLTRGIDQSDFPALAVRNPRANIGNPLYPGNKNFMLYSGAARPLQGSNLALHVGRWFSIALGALTLWLTFATARLAFGRSDTRALLTLALAAAVPQFAFIHASFSNDAMITCASVATLFWLARLVARTDDAPIAHSEWLTLGVLLGVAALSKLQGLGLTVVAAVAVMALAWHRRDLWLPLRAAPFIALPLLAIAGWWYARNAWLYGDWSGTTLLLIVNGQRTAVMDLADWWLEFRGLRYSFWGIFGWFNILLPGWFYAVLDVVTVAGLVGAVAALAARRNAGQTAQRDAQTRVLIVLLVWALLVLGLLISFTAQATASQGRLLFPAISALATLVVLGLHFWLKRLPRALGAACWAALLALLTAASLYTLAMLLPAAYIPAPPVAALPAAAQPAAVRYAADVPLDLVGVQTPTGRVQPGAAAPVTLFFSTPTTPTRDTELFVQLLDETGRAIANVTTHPGWGRNPTTFWRPGHIYPDAYALAISVALDNRAPLAARLYAGFVDPTTAAAGNQPLPATDAAGAAITPFVGMVILNPPDPPTVASLGLTPHGGAFGGVITLTGAAVAPTPVRAGGTLTATLLYNATGQPATDYTAFVHLLDRAGAQVAGFDQEPAPGRFPTALWRAGDVIAATLPITLPADLPAGDYQVVTGLYASASHGAQRLPVTDAAGHPAGDGWLGVGTIQVRQ